MALDPNTTITWFGHSCFEVRTPGGLVILFDPWFRNPKSPKSPDTVDRCDIMLVTHGHSDHFGDAQPIASRTRPYWPCIHELALWMGHHLPGGSDAVVGMNKGGAVEHRGIRIAMVHADHSAGEWKDETGGPAYLGEAVGFVVTLENGIRLYFAGDTELFGDMRYIAEVHRPDVAFLPIGGHYTMDPITAAIAVQLLGVKEVVPMHYGTFPILAGTPDALRGELARRGLEANVHESVPGQPMR